MHEMEFVVEALAQLVVGRAGECVQSGDLVAVERRLRPSDPKQLAQ